MHSTARYQLLDKLGEGGMGVVYKAWDRLTATTVALKHVTAPPQHLLLFTQAADDARLALAHEFQVLASLRHPHIIDVLDYGFDEQGLPFFTMTLLDQPHTILEVAATHSTHDNLRLTLDILQALAYVHRRGILHRDLKPANVLVDGSGRARVLDFGLALEQGQRVKGGASGTLLYMAPEVLLGEAPTPASDLYAVGLMLYELLVGKHPFYRPDEPLSAYMMAVMDGKFDAEALLKTVMLPQRPPAYPTEGVTTLKVEVPHPQPVPKALESAAGLYPPPADTPPPLDPNAAATDATLAAVGAVVMRLLAVDPKARYQQASEVIHDLCAAAHLPLPDEDAAIREGFLQAARLVGREAELGQLLVAYERAAGGAGALWLVGGESGVGKSRLLNELRIHAMTRGALVLRGQAVEGGGLPYHLWRDPLRRLVLSAAPTDEEAAVLMPLVPDIASLLERPIASAPHLAGPAEQQRLTLTISALCQRLNQPLVLLLEDLHWTRESLAVLQGLTAWVADQQWLIVATFRSDEAPTLPDSLPTAHVLPLARLDAEAITELSASMLGAVGRDAALVALLQRETEGNAYFMVEVVRALAEDAGRLGAIGQTALPTKTMAGGVQAILGRRLARVPRWGRAWLELAAVMGRRVEVALLTDTPSAQLEQWLTACINAAVLLREDGAYQFAHDKLRERLLDDLSATERASLHRQAALAIERVYANDRAWDGILAGHWDAAGEASRALHYILQAAPTLSAMSNFSEAQRLLERGLHLDPTPVQQWHLYKCLADVHDYYADTAQMSHYVTLALALPADLPTTQRGVLLMISGRVAARRGDYGAARADFEQALALLSATGSDTVGVLHNLGNLMKSLGDYAAAEGYYQRSLEAARALDSPQGLAITLNNLGNVAQARGEYAQARAYYEESLSYRGALHDRYGEAIVLNNLGNISKLLGDYAAARRTYEQALALDHQLGNQLGAAIVLGNLAELALLQGERPTACDYFSHSLHISRAIDDHEGVVICLRGLASTYARMEQPSDALPYLQEGLRAVVDGASEALQTIMLLALIDVRLAQGHAQAAAQLGGLLLHHPAAEQETRDEYRDVVRPQVVTAIGEASCQAAETAGATGTLATVLHEGLQE